MSTIDIKVLPLNQIHKQDWLALWQGYQQFYQVKLADDVSEHTWLKLTDEQCMHMYGFAALIGGKTAGIVHVIEHDSCWTVQPYAYLQDLYTDEAYRGQGVARKLIEQVHQYTQERLCDRVYWLTQQDNMIAQRLYDQVARKTGFIQYRM